MPRRHDRTLAAVFARPTPANLKWRDVEAMLTHLGANLSTSSGGSMVSVTLNGVRAVFHAPHPSPDATQPTVRSVARFLAEAGVRP